MTLRLDSIQSHRRLLADAARAQAEAARYLAFARETCTHPGVVCCLGIVLCPCCGASWGHEDPSAPKARPVPPEVFRRLEHGAP